MIIGDLSKKPTVETWEKPDELYWSICWDGFKVFKKPDDPEKLDEEVTEETSRRFEYDPWSGRGIAFTVTSTIVLIVLGEYRQN